MYMYILRIYYIPQLYRRIPEWLARPQGRVLQCPQVVLGLSCGHPWGCLGAFEAQKSLGRSFGKCPPARPPARPQSCSWFSCSRSSDMAARIVWLNGGFF